MFPFLLLLSQGEDLLMGHMVTQRVPYGGFTRQPSCRELPTKIIINNQSYYYVHWMFCHFYYLTQSSKNPPFLRPPLSFQANVRCRVSGQADQ